MNAPSASHFGFRSSRVLAAPPTRPPQVSAVGDALMFVPQELEVLMVADTAGEEAGGAAAGGTSLVSGTLAGRKIR